MFLDRTKNPRQLGEKSIAGECVVVIGGQGWGWGRVENLFKLEVSGSNLDSTAPR